jgi:hypothetical protein
MEIRNEQTENGFEFNIKVTNEDLMETIEDAQKTGNKVVAAIAAMDEKELDNDPALFLLLLSSVASFKTKQAKDNQIQLSKGRIL